MNYDDFNPVFNIEFEWYENVYLTARIKPVEKYIPCQGTFNDFEAFNVALAVGNDGQSIKMDQICETVKRFLFDEYDLKSKNSLTSLLVEGKE